MKKTSRNPIAFTPLPVTIITSVIYAGLLIALLVVHTVVPSAPRDASPVAGINITEAWHDLQTLSNGFHPYNSRRNDEIRDWILQRLDTILVKKSPAYRPRSVRSSTFTTPRTTNTSHEIPLAYVFNDMTSNFTSSASVFGTSGLSVYFEGTNVIVYIRGSEDDQSDWWKTPHARAQGKGGVLLNAHYDSVSTGFGATDDGVGVVSILQLIKYFTTPGHQPKRGIVALFNNGEEDFLNGARAFTQHPMSRFVHIFLNLEGAGAGGRAVLFRSTDTEVTRFYQKSPYPFGTALSGDGFRRGFVRSQTDYVVFDGILGLRGLDVAFMEPRARYHTDQDDTRHTSKDSLWHMLSAALSTTKALTQDTSSTFEGKNPDKGKVPSGSETPGVWFDLFGRAFVVFRLHTLFALSVTLLVVPPLVLVIIALILLKVDKLYLFSSSKHHHHSEGDDTVPLQGWRGFFRYPIIFILAAAADVGLAFLITKFNPFIVYSSPYAVWSMMLSAWVFVVWFFSRAADFARPTAFHRAYSLLWMFGGGWLILVFATVLEHRFDIAAGYFMVFYFAAIFLATMIAFLELFGLSRKSEYANDFECHENANQGSIRSASISSSRLLAPTADEQIEETGVQDDGGEEDATESTSLLRGRKSTTFANYVTPNRAQEPEADKVLEDPKKDKVFGYEQAWSWSLPSWTWILQFILMAFVATVFVGQIGLLFMSATYQTLADGNSALTVYIMFAVFSVLVLAPLGPFMHRYTYHIPIFLLCVLAGTLIYNLLAFPFSTNNRLKLYFVQKVDLDTGINEASLNGAGRSYIDEVIQNLPSASGQSFCCTDSKTRLGLIECSWVGLSPKVVPNTHPEAKMRPTSVFGAVIHVPAKLRSIVPSRTLVSRVQGKMNDFDRFRMMEARKSDYGAGHGRSHGMSIYDGKPAKASILGRKDLVGK
ncbi:MAG: hypothetical protein Q9187_005836 [Circinaria calcarea]